MLLVKSLKKNALHLFVSSLFAILCLHSLAQNRISELPSELAIRVLQFNIWQEGTMVKGGFDAIIDEIIQTNADLITLSEVRNYDNSSLDQRLIRALKDKGYVYYH